MGILFFFPECWGTRGVASSNRQRLNHAAAKRIPARATLEPVAPRTALQIARQPQPGSRKLGIGPARIRNRRNQSEARACQRAMPELRGVAFHLAFPRVTIVERFFLNFADGSRFRGRQRT